MVDDEEHGDDDGLERLAGGDDFSYQDTAPTGAAKKFVFDVKKLLRSAAAAPTTESFANIIFSLHNLPPPPVVDGKQPRINGLADLVWSEMGYDENENDRYNLEDTSDDADLLSLIMRRDENTLDDDRGQGNGVDRKKVEAVKICMQYGKIGSIKTTLSSKGIADVNDPKVKRAVQKKFPGMKPDQQDTLRDLVESLEPIGVRPELRLTFTDEEVRHSIMEKKKGAAKSLDGLSYDHLRLLLVGAEGDKHILQDLTIIINRIANGWLIPKSAARERLTAIRGVVFIKDDQGGIRPIGIGNPLILLAARLTGVKTRTKVATYCLPSQLGMSINGGGVEIVAHTVALTLEHNPRWIVIAGDIKNAFNAIFHKCILEALADPANDLTDLLAYARTLIGRIGGDHVKVSYKTKEGQFITVQRCGITQGNNLSGSFYAIGQDRSVRNTLELHQDLVIVSYHDDHFLLGPQSPTLDGFETLRLQLRINCGLLMTGPKIVLFGLGYSKDGAIRGKPDYDRDTLARAAALGITVKYDGLVVVGTPVGHDEFCTAYCVDKAGEIIKNMKFVEKAILSTSQHASIDAQMGFMIGRLCIFSQLNHLLRTVPPHLTFEACQKLDDYALHFVLTITRSHGFLPNIDTLEGKELMEQINLSIFTQARYGGCAYNSCVDTRRSAFIGSMLLCGSVIGTLNPELRTRDDPDSDDITKRPTARMTAFTDSVAWVQTSTSMVTTGKIPLEAVTLSTMWASSIKGAQSMISDRIGQAKQVMLSRRFPRPSGVCGKTLDRNWSAAKIIEWQEDLSNLSLYMQGRANVSKTASAWVTAWPFGPHCRMRDAPFIANIWIRLGFNVMGTIKFCICGAFMDQLGNHSFYCRMANIRNPLRNGAHASFCSVLRSLLRSSPTVRDGHHDISDREPLVSRFFKNSAGNPNGRKAVHVEEDGEIVPSTANVRADLATDEAGRTDRMGGNPMTTTRRRADIGIISREYGWDQLGEVPGTREHPNTLIDCTIVEVTAGSHRAACLKIPKEAAPRGGRRIKASEDPGLGAVNHGGQVKHKAYDAIFDTSENNNPNSKFVVFAMGTNGILGTEAFNFLKTECNVRLSSDDNDSDDADGKADMRRFITALSCKSANDRGNEIWNVINTYGLESPPDLVLDNSASIPRRTHPLSTNHPSNMLRYPMLHQTQYNNWRNTLHYNSPFELPPQQLEDRIRALLQPPQFITQPFPSPNHNNNNNNNNNPSSSDNSNRNNHSSNQFLSSLHTTALPFAVGSSVTARSSSSSASLRSSAPPTLAQSQSTANTLMRRRDTIDNAEQQSIRRSRTSNSNTTNSLVTLAQQHNYGSQHNLPREINNRQHHANISQLSQDSSYGSNYGGGRDDNFNESQSGYMQASLGATIQDSLNDSQLTMDEDNGVDD